MLAYGHDFVSGAPALVLLAGSAVLASVAAVAGQAVVSLGKAWYRLAVHAIWSATLLICAAALLSGEGSATKLALANLIACAVYLVAQYGFLRYAERKSLTEHAEAENAFAETSEEPAERLAA
jgi:O-antigen/teichoic acid export membrane protein